MNGHENLRSRATRSPRLWGGIAIIGISALSLVGCTGGATPATPTASAEAPAESPSAPAPDPSASAAAAAAADAAELPFPETDIPEWAKSAVPDSTADGWVAGFSGWLSENSSPRLRTEAGIIATGSYAVQVACRGNGTLTFDFTSPDGTALTSVECTNETIAIDVTLPQPGVTIMSELADEGEPTIFAISFQTAA